MENIFVLPKAEIKELNNASTFIIENNGDLNRGTIESLNTMLDCNKLKNAPVDREYLLASFTPNDLEYSEIEDYAVGIYELDLSILEKYNVDCERDLFKVVINDSIIIVEPSKLTMLAYSSDIIAPIMFVDGNPLFGILDNYLIIFSEVINLFDFDVTKIELFKYEKVNKNELFLKTMNIYKNNDSNMVYMKENIEYDSIVGDITIFYENLTFNCPVNKIYYNKGLIPYVGNIKGVLALLSGDENYILSENELPFCLMDNMFIILDSTLYDKVDINFYIQYFYITNQYNSHINLSEIKGIENYWNLNAASEFLNIQQYLLKGYKCFDALGKEITSCSGGLNDCHYNYIYQGQNISATISDVLSGIYYKNNIIIKFYDDVVQINGIDYNCTVEQDENNNLIYTIDSYVDYSLQDTNIQAYHNNRRSCLATIIRDDYSNYFTKINFIDYTITLMY